MSNDGRSLNARVIDAIESLIDDDPRTKNAIVGASGMARNTFFVKMRGETAFTTDDIDKIAAALDVTPEIVMMRAASATSVDDLAAARARRPQPSNVDEHEPWVATRDESHLTMDPDTL